MAIGTPINKNEIDSVAIDIARQLRHTFDRAAKLKEYLDATPDADLIALGYEAGDIAILKSAIADVNALADVFAGRALADKAEDRRVFVKRLWGIGL